MLFAFWYVSMLYIKKFAQQLLAQEQK